MSLSEISDLKDTLMPKGVELLWNNTPSLIDHDNTFQELFNKQLDKQYEDKTRSDASSLNQQEETLQAATNHKDPTKVLDQSKEEDNNLKVKEKRRHFQHQLKQILQEIQQYLQSQTHPTTQIHSELSNDLSTFIKNGTFKQWHQLLQNSSLLKSLGENKAIKNFITRFLNISSKEGMHALMHSKEALDFMNTFQKHAQPQGAKNNLNPMFENMTQSTSSSLSKETHPSKKSPSSKKNEPTAPQTSSSTTDTNALKGTPNTTHKPVPLPHETVLKSSSNLKHETSNRVKSSAHQDHSSFNFSGMKSHALSSYTTSATNASSVHVNQQALIEKIAHQIKTGVIHGKEVMRLSIKPEALGKVSIFLSRDDGRLSGKLFVENIAVKELLEGKMADLMDHLRHQHVRLEALEVDINHHNENNKPFHFEQEGHSMNNPFHEYTKEPSHEITELDLRHPDQLLNIII